jgi:diguanylate cyclase (GGDEF)-like protein
MFRYGSRGILLRLMCFSVLVIGLSFSARTVVTESVLRQGVGALSAAHQMSIATYIAEDIDEKLKLRFDLLVRLAAKFPAALLRRPPDARAWLLDRQASPLLFPDGLIIATKDGHAMSTAEPDLAAVDQADWFQAVWCSGRAAIGRPEHVLTLAVPVFDREGVQIAVLAGRVSLTATNLVNLLQSNRFGENGGFLLIDPRDGLFVAATDSSKTLTSLPPPGLNPLHDRAMAGYRGSGITVNADGVEELSAIASVTIADWFVVARQPLRDAYRPVGAMHQFILGYSIAASILIVIILAVWLKFLFQPLIDVARQLRAMGAGEMAIAPLSVPRLDEVGEVANGFNFLLGKLRDSEARMAHMAYHDAMTGLPNRIMFDDRLSQAIAQAERRGSIFAIIYIDLDRFKPVNDRLGHDAGDAALSSVAQRLLAEVRKGDTVARIGGDEFAIILLDLSRDRNDADHIKEKIRAAIAQPILYGDQVFEIGASLGIAFFPQDGDQAETLLCAADRAMYRDKNATER